MLATLLLGATVAFAASGTPPKRTVDACFKSMRALAPKPRSLHGSADPSVLGAFSVFRKPVRPNLDISHNLDGPVSSYDPTHAGLLISNKHGQAYLVPVRLGTYPETDACKKVPDADAYFAAISDIWGSGPGVCTVSSSPDSPTDDLCTSLSRIEGYSYPAGPMFGSTTSQLVPDGVSRVDYAFADGKVQSRSVSHNLVSRPHPPDPPKSPATFTAAYGRALKRWFAKALPTQIVWLNANGSVIAIHRRPHGLVTTETRMMRFASIAVASERVK
ncbi:MAG: hypothetical protein J2O48_10315 [Solirubrobacterales bacterium]|nr:hypothetical protein [Solirubrobacterales bacterium]